MRRLLGMVVILLVACTGVMLAQGPEEGSTGEGVQVAQQQQRKCVNQVGNCSSAAACVGQTVGVNCGTTGKKCRAIQCAGNQCCCGCRR
jgi:hypothetical protein